MTTTHDQIWEIYKVCPKHQDEYATMTKNAILRGEFNSTELQTMWGNTKLFVIRPTPPWEEQNTASFETLV